MEIWRQVADLIILLPLFVTIVVNVFVENANATREQILPKLYQEIFANATIFLVIDMMANCAAVQIMDLAVVENVFALVHMMFQVTQLVNVRLLMKLV
jgi:hypothetical protein